MFSERWEYTGVSNINCITTDTTAATNTCFTFDWNDLLRNRVLFSIDTNDKNENKCRSKYHKYDWNFTWSPYAYDWSTIWNAFLTHITDRQNHSLGPIYSTYNSIILVFATKSSHLHHFFLLLLLFWIATHMNHRNSRKLNSEQFRIKTTPFFPLLNSPVWGVEAKTDADRHKNLYKWKRNYIGIFHQNCLNNDNDNTHTHTMLNGIKEPVVECELNWFVIVYKLNLNRLQIIASNKYLCINWTTTTTTTTCWSNTFS